jgi:hypothetical protein
MQSDQYKVDFEIIVVAVVLFYTGSCAASSNVVDVVSHS